MKAVIFMRSTASPKVIVTSHQASFTHEAMLVIAEMTFFNLADFAVKRSGPHRVHL
jgi:lactate dehydrogenase-like 2-hydroxyacid dehydrogenase